MLRLKNRIDELLRISREAEFTQYLQRLRARVEGEERQIGRMADELERNVQVYESRQQAQRQPAARREDAGAVAAPMPGQIRPRRSAEFTVGVAVLSIVGGIFILISMTMLGMYFMKGMTKGLILYAVSLLVLILSEAVLYRRWPRLGMTFSAIGMGGLYISTLINYLVLHNFGYWAALAVNIATTAVALILSRRRDAAVYRIFGMAAMYACLLILPAAREQMEGGLSRTQFLTVTVTVFLINVMCLLIPVRKSHTGIYVTHLTLNTAFTLIAYIENGTDAEFLQQFPFVILSLLAAQLIFTAQVRWHGKQTSGDGAGISVGICIAYGLSGLFYALLASDASQPYRLWCSIAVAAVCLIPVLILRGRQEKWFAWYLLNLLVFVIYLESGDGRELSFCLLALLAASKLVSFGKNRMAGICDAAVTLAACAMTLICSGESYALFLAAGLILSVACINYWHVFFALVLTGTLDFYTTAHMLPALKLPVFTGILFVGLLLFNNVTRLRGRGMLAYNVCALAGQAVCFLLLANPIYRNSYLTYLCMLVFGVATLVICMHEKYHLDFQYRQLVLAVFLTYMGIVIRTSYPIVNSILLMTLALFCVGEGFAARRKEVRVYGLALSLAVCAKLVIYDFMGANILQKTILFFVVGVIALMIAAIYMVLERSRDQRNGNGGAAEEQSPGEEQSLGMEKIS